jgi:hypothetical protein
MVCLIMKRNSEKEILNYERDKLLVNIRPI